MTRSARYIPFEPPMGPFKQTMRLGLMIGTPEMYPPMYGSGNGLVKIGDQVRVLCQDDPTFASKPGVVKLLNAQNGTAFIEMATGGGIWWHGNTIEPLFNHQKHQDRPGRQSMSNHPIETSRRPFVKITIGDLDIDTTR